MLTGDMEQARRLQCESQALQAEIDALRCRHKDTESSAIQFKGRIQEELLSLSGNLAAEEMMSRMTAEVEEMEEDLKRQVEINGIILTRCTVKTLHKDDTLVVQQHSLVGSCVDLEFQVDFKLSEAQSKTITEMAIVLDTDNMQISSFVSRGKELRYFFTLIQQSSLLLLFG